MVLDFLKNESYTIVTNMSVFKNCIHTHTREVKDQEGKLQSWSPRCEEGEPKKDFLHTLMLTPKSIFMFIVSCFVVCMLLLFPFKMLYRSFTKK